jgi:hypothetical protein
MLKLIPNYSNSTNIFLNLYYKNYFSEIIEKKYPNHINIFTDGLKSPNGTGFTFVENNNKTLMFKPALETSTFSAKSQAIEKAISYGGHFSLKKFSLLMTLSVHSSLYKTLTP